MLHLWVTAQSIWIQQQQRWSFDPAKAEQRPCAYFARQSAMVSGRKGNPANSEDLSITLRLNQIPSREGEEYLQPHVFIPKASQCILMLHTFDPLDTASALALPASNTLTASILPFLAAMCSAVSLRLPCQLVSFTAQ